MFDKLKDTLTEKKLFCSNCGKRINTGEKFSADFTMPPEKNMLVGKLDNVIAKSADKVLCDRCQE